MVFVPVHHPPAPSARAQELGERLAQVIAEYEAGHPGLSAFEVAQAAQLAVARQAPPATPAPVRVLLIAIVGAFFVLALGLGIARGGSGGGEVTTVVIAVAIVAALATALILRRR